MTEEQNIDIAGIQENKLLIDNHNWYKIGPAATPSRMIWLHGKQHCFTKPIHVWGRTKLHGLREAYFVDQEQAIAWVEQQLNQVAAQRRGDTQERIQI